MQVQQALIRLDAAIQNALPVLINAFWRDWLLISPWHGCPSVTERNTFFRGEIGR